MLRPCLKKVVMLFILYGTVANATEKLTYHTMPSADDLRYFVNAIDNVVTYVEHNKTVLHLPDFTFGLFLANVNFKSIKVNTNKFLRVPLDIVEQLDHIQHRIDRLLFIVNATASDFLSQKSRAIYHLYENISRWSDQLPSFHLLYRTLAVVDDSSPVKLGELYKDYRSYVADIKDSDKWEPSPETSDDCLVALSSYEYLTQTKKFKLCDMPMSCENVLKTGTDFGYALSHRILLLAVARLGIGCSLLGQLQDEELKAELCQAAYDEGRFIAKHDYDLIDLMLEHIVVCSMLGHTEFLRRDWLEESIRHQTSSGCFFDPLFVEIDASGERQPECSLHLTGLAVAALGSGVRWILENDFAPDNALYNDTKMPILPFLRRLYLINSHNEQSNKLSAKRYTF